MFFSDFSIHKLSNEFQQRREPSFKKILFDDVYISYSNYLIKEYQIGKSIYFVFGIMIGDAELLLKNEDYLNCNGNYLIVKVEGHRVHVITNRLNTMQCYFSVNGIHTYFHNAIPENKTLDWTGLGSYFTNGFFNNNRTFANEVKLLLNAHEYIFDNNLNLVSQKQYWNFNHHISNRSYMETVDEFASILNEIKNDYLKLEGQIAMPISGGLDSRTITGLFSQNERDSKRLWSYSYGFGANSPETYIASKIAKVRKLNFEKIATGNYLKAKIPLIQRCVEHFQYIDGTRQADISDKLEANSSFVICAHWGDVWNDTMGDQSEYSLEDFAIKKLKKKGADWFVKNLLELKVNDAQQELKESLDIEMTSKDFAIKVFKTLQWSQRWTLASTRMFQAGAFPLYPFYDNRIIDFFCTVPSSFVSDRKLQIDYLKKYHPDLAKIKWQEYDSNLYWYKILNNRNIVYRIVHKARRVLKSTKQITRNWELFYLNDEGKALLQKNIIENEALHPIISREVLQQFYQQFYNEPNAKNGYTMSMLHTFSLFMNKYFSKK